ncbi:homeobox protein MSX-1-like [Ylistrum balloti]|uniref:homeobox protein MSX-1-like n=1 Tax=Ylistrum balloti TaxID=509963 RepID=UPI00290582E9|nr:homeobox protein MSX-1-like [Ylistrum balloti]
MDMFASIFAANYAFYSNMQGRRPIFYAPVACHPSQVRQFLSSQNSSNFRGPTDLTSMNFSRPSEQRNDSEGGTTNHKNTEPDVKFSIDRILNERREDPETDEDDIGERNIDEASQVTDPQSPDSSKQYPWLQCTRYKPPKLPRIQKKEVTKKRKLGRNPRVPFTQHQVAALEQKFRQTHYLSSMDVAELSTALTLTETRVKIWFQNRRARERRDREANQRGGLLSAKAVSTAVAVTSSPWSFPMYPSHPALAQYRDVTQANLSAFTPVTSSTS